MAIQMINVEKSKFIEKNIDIFTSNKLGQYSKFLDKNQIFVTYYSVNEAMSTVDLGTGNIDTLFGAKSPLRYNKITYLPVYNIPELKPNFDVSEEEGPTTTLEISDIIFLPSTIKPKPYDCMIVSLGGAQEILFQVSSYQYNTIQSNDYYTADFTMYTMGKNLEAEYLSMNIVESYQTVFENIGTQDKCFIRTDDIEKINTLVRLIQIVKRDYMEKFYDESVNSFVLKKNSFDYRCKIYVDSNIVVEGVPTPKVDQIETTHVDFDEWLYDPFLEKFLVNTGIMESDDATYSLALTQNDILQPDFDSMYSRSLWHALELRTDKLLEPYLYFYQLPVRKRTSPFLMYGRLANAVVLTPMKENNFLSDRVLQKSRIKKATKNARADYIQLDLDLYSDEKKVELKKIYNNALIKILSAKSMETMDSIVTNAAAAYKKVMTKEEEKIRQFIILIKDDGDRLIAEYPDMDASILQIINESVSSYIDLFYGAPIETMDSLYDSFVVALDEIRVTLTKGGTSDD